MPTPFRPNALDAAKAAAAGLKNILTPTTLDQRAEQVDPSATDVADRGQVKPFIAGALKGLGHVIGSGQPGVDGTPYGMPAIVGAVSAPHFGPISNVAEEAGEITSPLLREIFSKNPAAQGIYNQAMRSQMDQVVGERATGALAENARLRAAHEGIMYQSPPAQVPVKAKSSTSRSGSSQKSIISTAAPNLGLPNEPQYLELLKKFGGGGSF